MELSTWFYGKDILIEIISAWILLSISYYIYGYKKINKEQKRYTYLLGAFILLFTSFTLKVLSYLIVYSQNEKNNIDVITIIHQSISSSSLIVFGGLLTYRILTILALYLLLKVYTQKQTSSMDMLVLYLLLTTGYLSHAAYYIFHLTALILLLLITTNIYKNYLKNKNKKTKLLAYSFGTIMLSQGVSMFLHINPSFYIIAELIQLIGYSLLLITFIKVLRDAKKKTTN